MHAGRQVIARAHDRPEIAHVELSHPEIALPPDHVHGMKGVDDARVHAVALDVNFPLASFAIGGGRRLGGRQHPTIKLRMLPQQASFGQLDRLWGFDDEQEHRTRLDDDAIGRALGDYDVVAGLEGQHPVVGLESPVAGVYELDLVAVRIADEVRHCLGPAGEKDPRVRTRQDLDRPSVDGAQVGGGEVRAGKGTGPEWAVNPYPSGRRVPPVQVRCRSDKPPAAVLFLMQALRNPYVGLVWNVAFLDEIHRGLPTLFRFMTSA